MSQNYYEILELRQDAPHHEVVRSYERTKLAYAADSPALYTMFTEEEAAEMRRLIDEAFKILGNPTKRKEYDQILLARKSTETTTDLPDFGPMSEMPTVSTPEKNSTTTSRLDVAHPTSTNTIPDGFARSRLSIYQVNPDFEAELKACETFDGDLLRRVRTYKNINLDQISKETRISRSYIAAVEANDYEALPAPVFVRGFVVQLARILGLDENKVAAAYMEKMRSPSS